MDEQNISKYKGGKLSEIVISSLKPVLEKIKTNGIKKSISVLFPNFDADEFVLKKIKSQLVKRRGIELSGLGRADVQYRAGGIQIEFSGIIRFFVKKITITDAQITNSFDDIINQIEKKYILDSQYIIEKTDDIVSSLSGTEIYKPKTSEEKTLYDLAALILINYYKAADEIPDWIEPALVNIGKGEFIEKWIEILADYISQVISKVSEDIFFNFKVTFDSVAVRTFLNKKTNRGQVSKMLSLLGVNVKEIVYKFAKSYVSPSFIKGASEILSDLAGSFLSDISTTFSEKFSESSEQCDDSAFNITVTLGSDVFSQRNLTWYTHASQSECILEYGTDLSFEKCSKIKVDCEKVLKAVPVLNLGLISSYKLVIYSKYGAVLSNPEEGNVYYRIVSVGSQKTSEVFKLDVKKPSQSTKFMILADSQGMVKSDYQSFLNMFEAALKKEKSCDFVAHLGDFVDDGNNEEYWKWVLNSKAWCENAAVPLSGNHEARISALAHKAGVENSILGHFALHEYPFQNESKGVYYSFVYNNITFMVLNTNSFGEYGMDAAQYRWALEKAKSAKTKWKILLTHKTPYSNGPHHNDPDVKTIGKQIKSLAYEGGVDAVFGGHDHVYVRTPFLNEDTEFKAEPKLQKFNGKTYKTFENPGGTVFVVPGTSGVKNYKQICAPDFPVSKILDLSAPVYSKVTVKGETLCFDSYSYDFEKNEFKNIDSFAIIKEKNPLNRPKSSDVQRFIDSIPEIPYIDNGFKIEKALKMYRSLDYYEKIKVKNYNSLLKAQKINESYLKIINGEIRTVSTKHEFMQALKDECVGTIITACEEIKFENRFSGSGCVKITRDLCIMGSAKLSHVRFILSENAVLILSGSVCVDNTRKPFSLYPARNIVEMADNSVFALVHNATLNSGYGTGFKGCGINMWGENSFAYLESSGHNFVSKGFLFSSSSTSKAVVKSGKYFSSGGNYALNVSGSLTVSGGFIRSIKGFCESEISINGGIVGENNKSCFPVPVESFGTVKLKSGTVKAREGVSVVAHGGKESVLLKNPASIDIKGKIIYN